jgi:hypothetical protein
MYVPAIHAIPTFFRISLSGGFSAIPTLTRLHQVLPVSTAGVKNMRSFSFGALLLANELFV